MRLALPLTLLCLAPLPAAADAVSDTLCPILARVAGESAGAIPEMAQAGLVLQVADAYGYDHDALMTVLGTADAATKAACPEARAAVLAATGKDTLTAAMR